MVAAPQEKPCRWFVLTPDRLVLALLAAQGVLLLCEWIGWFAKGYAVLSAVASVGAALLLMWLWFLASLVFRRRFQFGIRSLLLLTLAVAISCSWMAVARKEAKKQQEVVAEIVSAGGTVSYDYQFDMLGNSIPGAMPTWPQWMGKLLGHDMFADVTLVDCTNSPNSIVSSPASKFTDATLEHLKGLTKLQYLRLESTEISDVGLKHLKGLTKLQFLDLEETKVSDAGLQHFKGLTQLQTLAISETQITDAGLQHLQGLTQLKVLRLIHTKVSDAGMECLRRLTQLQRLDLALTDANDAGLEHLKGLTQLQWLSLDGTHISDAGLEHLKGMTKLQMLGLGETQITDAGLQHLKTLSQLQMLILDGAKVSDAGVKKIQIALPKTQINNESTREPILPPKSPSSAR